MAAVSVHWAATHADEPLDNDMYGECDSARAQAISDRDLMTVFQRLEKARLGIFKDWKIVYYGINGGVL